MLTRMISVEQNILVTGSSRGIGRAIADLLHEAGHRVVGHASRPFPDDSPDAPEWDVVAADFSDFRGPDLLWQEAIDLLDGRIDGQIDQIGQLLLLRRTPAEAKKFQAIGKWAGTLGTLQQAVLTKLA